MKLFDEYCIEKQKERAGQKDKKEKKGQGIAMHNDGIVNDRGNDREAGEEEEEEGKEEEKEEELE